MRTLFASLAALVPVLGALAQPAPPPSPASPTPPFDAKALLSALDREGRSYAEARRALSVGRASEALAKLKGRDPTGLLGDREALLRGDALLALGEKQAAKDAYQLAHDRARSEAVRLRAARGLIGALGQLGDRDAQLKMIEELLAVRTISRRPTLLLERANILSRLGRGKEAAEAAWRVVLDFPSTRTAEEAQALLERLRTQGVPSPASSARVELLRLQQVSRSGELTRAATALDALAAKVAKEEPGLVDAVDLERAEVLRLQKNRRGEITALEALAKRKLDDKIKLEVLDRLGRAHLAIDDHVRAVQWFDAMKVAFPRKTRTVDAQFMAAWSRYNRGEYADAAQAFLAHAGEYKRWRRRAESLWFAGWSAYRAADDALARRAFDQVLVDHPTSEMALWAHYWGGRIRERSQDTEGARAAYRNVLRIAPLSYQASWAAVRLERLGERVVMSAPRAPERPAGLVDVLTLLGATRPVGVDRGIALHRAGLEEEAVEELDEANGELAKVKDMRGRVMIAEMLESLGAHHQAYRFATRLTQSGADLVTGEPYAWRAWRLAYPKAFEAEVKAAAEAHDIDPLLLLSIMRSESSFRPTARSPVGARGLMQLMPATAKRIGKVAAGGRPHAGRYGEPASNVWLGAWYLKQLLGRYDGQVALAAGAYNAGPGAMDRWLESGRQLELDTFVETISYRETRLYVRKVLETYQIYRRLDAAPELDLHWVVSADVPKRDSSVAF